MKTEELIYKRIKNHEGRIKNKNKTNKRVYLQGDRVMLQKIKTKGPFKYYISALGVGGGSHPNR